MSNPYTSWKEEDLASFGDKLRRLALRLVADEATADDLAQEAWLVLQRRGDLGVEDLGAYLRGVLRNLSLKRHDSNRRRKLRERNAARPEATPSVTGVDETLAAQRSLVEELEQLPADLREVLLQRYYEGLSCSEIARHKGLPASTVRSRLARGIAEMRERLDRRSGGRREVWASGLLRAPAEAGALGIGSTLFGVLSMSLLFKCALVAGIAATGIFLWPDGQSPKPLELAQGAEVESSDSLEEMKSSTEGGVAPSDAPQRALIEATKARGLALDARRRVRVVDRATGEPAPDYLVRIEAGEGAASLELTTDLAGEFELTDPSAQWDFELVALDHSRRRPKSPERWSMAEAAQASASKPLRFEVDLGPTYRLHLPPGAPAGELRAELSRQPFSPHLPLGELWPGIFVRRDATPWVRFGPENARPELLGNGPWFLRVSDLRGVWQAWGEVDSIVGVHARTVSLSGPAFGLAEIQLTCAGEPPAEPVWLHVNPRQETETWSMGVRALSTRSVHGGPPGLVNVHYLPAGSYVVSTGEGAYRRTGANFEVVEGAVTRVDLDLERGEASNELLVVLGSESGSIELRFTQVSLHPTLESQGKALRGESVSGAPEGEAHFQFRDLGEQAWRLELSSVGHLPRFDVEKDWLVRSSMGEVRLTCLDRSEGDMVAQQLRIIDADTREELQTAGLSLWVGAKPLVSLYTSGGGVALPSMQRGTTVDCLIQAAGYRPRIMESAPYPLDLPGDEVAVVALQPGWGLMFVARNLEGSPRLIEGVEVLMNGKPAGRTDARGRVLVSASEEPASLELIHPDYEYVIGGIDPETKKLRRPGMELESNEMFRPR